MRKHLRNAPLLRHARHAEWGHGIVYEENSAKIHLCFEDGSRRVFLNAPRYRQQFVPADLPPREAAEVRATIEGFLPEEAPKRPRPRTAARATAAARAASAHPPGA